MPCVLSFSLRIFLAPRNSVIFLLCTVSAEAASMAKIHQELLKEIYTIDTTLQMAQPHQHPSGGGHDNIQHHAKVDSIILFQAYE